MVIIAFVVLGLAFIGWVALCISFLRDDNSEYGPSEPSHDEYMD